MNKDLEQFSEEKLMDIIEFRAKPTLLDGVLLARIALSVKQAKPIGEVRLSEYRSDGTREASIVCLHDQADWDNFTDGTKLYLNQNPVTQMNQPSTPQPAHTEHGIPSEIPKVPHNGVMAYKKDGSIYSTNYARGWNDCIQAALAAAPKPESE